MKKENKKLILFRYFIIAVFISIFAICIVIQVVRTTVVDAKKWNDKANAELSRTLTIPPERGEILACDGSLLATNLNYYTIRIDFRSEKFMADRYVAAIDSLADSLALHFPIRDKQQWAEYLKSPMAKPANKRPRGFCVLKRITFSDYLLLKTFPFLKINNPNRNGLIREPVVRRCNPYGDMAYRSIGSVGEDSATGKIHGYSGLEKALDSLLYGVPGTAKKVPLTKNIVNWTDIPAKNGYTIRTTIDINMQDIVENELNRILELTDADWGVAVLMQVSTGDIKAISNLEKSKNSREYIEGMNRAVRGFEPGSVMKPISMLIALEDGIVDNIDAVIPIGPSYAYAGGRPITDSHVNSSLTVSGVIEQSSNIGMTKIMTPRFEKDPDSFRERLKEIGFLDPMNTGISGECVPNIPRLKNNRGGRISLSRMVYGYSTEIPPLYTLSIYNAIANGGRYVRPRLVQELIGSGVDSVLPVTYIRQRICSEENAAKLQAMLRKVVRGDHGTARILRNDLVEIAGKTGTCYMVNEIDKNSRDAASGKKVGGYDTSRKRLAFCGFFPADNPLYSCIVLTCNPKKVARGAASTSGTVVKNIALKMYSRGMLDNSSDYLSETNPGTRPVFYATDNPQKRTLIEEGLDISSARHFKTTAADSAGVPSVIGYGLRDAVVALEKRGYDVDFTGSGYVVSQTPPAGTRGEVAGKVMLNLTEY